MNTKSKGTVAERELIQMFWDNGWAAFRAAGSGSARHPCPDVIAGNVLRKLAVECKRSQRPYQYLTKVEIDALTAFSARFGAESWVGVKFDRIGWYFIMLEDLRETREGYVVDEDIARNRGLLFEELIS